MRYAHMGRKLQIEKQEILVPWVCMCWEIIERAQRKKVKIKILHNPIISFQDPLTVFILEKERCIPNQTVALNSRIQEAHELVFFLCRWSTRTVWQLPRCLPPISSPRECGNPIYESWVFKNGSWKLQGSGAPNLTHNSNPKLFRVRSTFSSFSRKVEF